MKREWIVAGCVAWCFCARWAEGEVIFPNADGSGDFSSAAAWSGALPEGPVLFNKSTPSVKALQDVTLAGLTFNCWDKNG